jgi:HlyD family secretion protein
MRLSWRRVAFWGVLVVLLAAGLGYALWPRAVPVDLVKVARGPLVVTVDEEGETRVKDVYVVSAPISGRALRIDSDVGDTVIAGQTIVALIEPIDPTLLDVRTEAQAKAAVSAAEAARALAAAELERAEADRAFAASDLKRAQGLIRRETISKRSLDEAQRNFRTAQAAVSTARAGLRMRESELEKARAQLITPTQTRVARDKCDCVTLTAPVNGRILSIRHESEGVVMAGEDLVEIGDPTRLEIVVDLLSADAVKVRAGQRVIIDDWGGPEPLNGVVRRVEPTGFTKVSALGIEEQRVNVIIDFTDPPELWRHLGHGYRIEARIVLWEGKDVLKLPLSALFREGEQWTVFVVDGGSAHRRAVELGRLSGREAQIVGGLSEGDTVVLHPSDRVVDGVRVVQRDAIER